MTTTQLASGLGGAIGSHFVQATHQLFFVEIDGKVSVFDLVPRLEATGPIGHADVPPDTSLDLTTPDISDRGGDIRWDHESPGRQRVLRPQGNSRLCHLGQVDYAALDHASLASLPYPEGSLVGEGANNQIVAGAVFAVSNLVRQPVADWDYAKVQVIDAGATLRLRWLTYRVQPRYRVLGAGYSQPQDIVVAADGRHAYVTERTGNLLRVDLANANRTASTVVASGMTAPQQIALDEPHAQAYVVEFNGSRSRLWRVELNNGTKTAVVSTLNNAVGLLATADMSVAYVGQQTAGATSVCRVSLENGRVDVLPIALTAPFFMTWAGPGESGILITERDPANRVTLLDLTASPVAIAPVATVPPGPSSVAVVAANRLLVCCNEVLVECDLTGSVFTGTGPMLLGIGNVPKSTISGDGYATTDSNYFFRVTDSPFGGTLAVMFNHEKANGLGARYYQVLINGVVQNNPWSDYKWSSALNQFVLAPAPRFGDFFEVRRGDALWYSHWLGYRLASAALLDGPRTLDVRIYANANADSEIRAGHDSQALMIDNQWPRATIDSVIRHQPGNPNPNLRRQVIGTCGIVQGASDEFSFSIQAQDPVAQHLMSWSLVALWGDNKSATIASDSYERGHVSADHRWTGVSGEVPAPHWHATVTAPGNPPRVDVSSRRCAHTFSLTVWDRVIDGSSYIHRSSYNKSVTLLLD